VEKSTPASPKQPSGHEQTPAPPGEEQRTLGASIRAVSSTVGAVAGAVLVIVSIVAATGKSGTPLIRIVIAACSSS
jgi:hypothetical protein